MTEPRGVATRTRAWTPDMFLAEGVYCPSSVIQRWIHDLQDRLGVRWLLLLPFPPGHDDTGFGSLMMVAHESERAAGKLQDEIVDATTTTAAHRIAEFLRELALIGRSDRRSSRVSAEQLTRLRAAEILAPLLRRHDLDGGLELRRPPRWSTRTGVRFFILCPRRGDDGEGVSGRIVRDEQLSELQTMLNATRQAALRLHEQSRHRPRFDGDDATTRMAGPKIADLLPGQASSHFGPADGYSDLLQAARGIHKRLTVAIFLLDREGTHLTCTSGLGLGARIDDVRLDADSSSIAFVVGQNRPPRIMNSVRSEPLLHSSMQPRWLGRRPVPADFSEIVVPISSTAAGGRVTVVGALVAQRRTIRDEEIFDARDLDFLEQLAFRISLRRANLLFDEATHTLAEVTGHTMISSAGSFDPAQLDPIWQDVPIDYLNARRLLERTSELAYRHTACIGVALALLDVRHRFIIRVTDVGRTGLLPARWDSRARTEGLAAMVSVAVQDGREVAVPDTKQDGAFSAYGGRIGRDGWDGIRSAIAIPVTVLDRPIGAIVVAAARPRALRGSGSYLRAVAQHIGVAMLLAQRAEEQRAFAVASSTTLHAHEILKRVDRLQQHPSSEVNRIGHEIERLLDTLRSADRGDEILVSNPLEAIDEAIRSVGLHHFVTWVGQRPQVPPVPPQTILAVKRAAVEILDNSKLRFVSGTESPRIEIRSRIEQRGPLPHLVVELQHVVGEPLDPAVINRLYRAPIDDGDMTGGRRHFGAFTAGYWLRAIGGDAYIWRAETDGRGRHWVGTALDIPVLTLAQRDPDR